ncbi:hypothetical protein G647_00930 [Cladophialophora carrionii CBS 160.54]|uniref:Uncharacterized protein n=1 Tax=Cladophialophora carrionii CBS 160.54 TaxID=1279043 RepID=V9DPA3_9EURO|nr:uncharacterized protein G647_00930 [Cladophialophora carrionii CBS 160.54]ETI28481.1 hypothetical protein G647_00930 [Cladophialophora carrionii CBS 160.54]
MYASRVSARQLFRRSAPSDSLIATIIVVSVLSTLLVASMILLLSRMWKKIISRRSDAAPLQGSQNQGAGLGCKPSDWARKDSNVLWSMYITEDDLKAQFAVSPKSRLFSIGSVSTIDHAKCPLDRRQSHAHPSAYHSTIEDRFSQASDTAADLRNRTPYEHQTTPTKNTPRARAMSQPSKHKYTSFFEAIANRKQSLPLSLMVEAVNEGYGDYSGP